MRATPKHRKASGTLGLCVLALVAGPSVAVAQSPDTSEFGVCEARRALEVVIDPEQGGAIDVVVAPGLMTVIELPESLPLEQARFTEQSIAVLQLEHSAEIIPSADVRPDLHTTVRLRTRTKANVVVNLRVASESEQHTRFVLARTEPRAEICKRAVRPYIDETVERRTQERVKDLVRTTIAETSRQLLSTTSIYNPRTPVIDYDSPIRAIPGAAAWLHINGPEGASTSFVWAFVVENEAKHAFRVATARLVDSEGNERLPHVEFDPTVAREDDLLAIIPGGHAATGVVTVENAEYEGDSPLTLELLSPDGKRLTFTKTDGFEETQVKVRWAVPIPPGELQRRREEREQLRREREAKRVSLHVLASYGAIWLPADVDDSDATEATSMKGLGVRITKGITPMWAFEAEIAAATSGTATFRDVNGMGDVLTRSAKLGRAQFGALARFGDKVIPHVRFGVGLQLVSRDATMTGGSADAPGVGTDFTDVLMFGAGVDWRLGDQLTAGLGVTVVTPRDQELLKRTIDGGIHVSYAWKP